MNQHEFLNADGSSINYPNEVIVQKFKEINFAHEILSNAEKREIYDEGGEEALQQHAQGGGGNPFPDDILDMLIPGMGRRRRPTGPKKSPDIGMELGVSLEELRSFLFSSHLAHISEPKL